MMYILVFTEKATKEIKQLTKSGNKAIIKKLSILLKELQNHPYEGVGQPEQLKGNLSGYWSRRLDRKNRIIYKVREEYIEVSIISVKGHYDDK